MHIILGGTGHVGAATAKALLAKGEPVTIVTRDASKGRSLADRGAKVAVADIHDPDALRSVLQQGERLFLVNPPADPSTDTDAEEHKTIDALLTAIDGSGLKKIVAQSTYGVRPGKEIGDLGTLYALEAGLKAQPLPVSVVRAAYFLSNWDAMLTAAKGEGVVHTMLPADLRLPMVAPEDVGEVAARLLTEPLERTGVYHVEGPERHTAAEVAAAFAAALGKPVKAAPVPREAWEETFKGLGFSDAAAKSYAGMTALTVSEPQTPDQPVRGSTSLQAYISNLVGTR